jgi:hypothetical protein
MNNINRKAKINIEFNKKKKFSKMLLSQYTGDFIFFVSAKLPDPKRKINRLQRKKHSHDE